jgi:hypothetical protein
MNGALKHGDLAADSRPRPFSTAVVLGSLVAILPAALSQRSTPNEQALVVESGAPVIDALHSSGVVAVESSGGAEVDARAAVDGRDETAWVGRSDETRWIWSTTFARPVHLGLLRAHFGRSVTSGVPTTFHWEARAPRSDATCDGVADPGDEGWTSVEDADPAGAQAWPSPAAPARRSWFVDVDACALRIVLERTNGGAPVMRELKAIESARDVLRDATASDDGAAPGHDANGAIDGTYAGHWQGEPGKGRWTLRIDLPEARVIDRVRLVLGLDAVSTPRAAGGRSYAIAWAPVRYTLETSDDGSRFYAVARESRRADGSTVPLRRRMVTMVPRKVLAIRLVMEDATGLDGLPDLEAGPVVREIAAYRADDAHPVLAAPWILSVNANPSAQTHDSPGGEWANDAYHARFLHGRFAPLVPALARDDRFAGMPGPFADPDRDGSGEVFESIEGDDPALDTELLAESSPPPIAVLSGSNDWDYAPKTGPDGAHPRRWHWNPLRDASSGGMGQLAPAVARRVAPFLGFCGGAQILALLEAERLKRTSPEEDERTIDRVLKRTSGHPIRGFAPPTDLERAWPSDPHPKHETVSFTPDDPLFVDLAGPSRRTTTQALPESHADAIRTDAFLPGGVLQRFEVLASSAFCSPTVVAAGPRDGAFPNPHGEGWCDTIPEAFRSRDPAWPVIGAQFHPEQRDFYAPAPGDPPESVADPRLFLVGAYEQIVDAYERFGP